MLRSSLYSLTLAFLVACSTEHPLATSQQGTSHPTIESTPIPTASDAGADVYVAPVEDAGSDASVCLGDSPAYDTKCPTSGVCGESCAHVALNYRAGVASYVADCLAKHTTSCDEYDVINCIDQAAALSCASDTADAYCTGFVRRCDPDAGGDGSAINQTGCVMYARALTPAGREKFQGCFEAAIESGNCAPNGAISCADEIRQ